MTTLSQKGEEFTALLWKLGESLMTYRFRLGRGLADDLSKHDGHIIFLLGSEGQLAMGELAERIQRSVSSATMIVDKLAEKELVERTRSAADRRVVHVVLTPRGKEVYQFEHDTFQQVAQAVLSALGPQEQDTFLALTRKISAKFSEQIQSSSNRVRS